MSYIPEVMGLSLIGDNPFFIGNGYISMSQNTHQPLTFLSLSSGSSGNCFYIEYCGNAILVDAGVGIRSVERWLSERNIDIRSISAILLTHDHTDHTKAVGSISKKYRIPVITTEPTYNAINRTPSITTSLDEERTIFIKKFEPICIGALTVEAFGLPHDAADSLGYRIIAGDKVLTLLTDLGHLPSSVEPYIRESTHLVIESNYDKAMLANSSYPYSLQQRISGNYGHLSNEQSAHSVVSCYHDKLEYIWLCHLSEECNTPMRALDTMRNALQRIGVADGLQLVALPRREPSDIYIL